MHAIERRRFSNVRFESGGAREARFFSSLLASSTVAATGKREYAHVSARARAHATALTDAKASVGVTRERKRALVAR